MYIMNAIDKPVLFPIINAWLSFNPILDSLVVSVLACPHKTRVEFSVGEILSFKLFMSEYEMEKGYDIAFDKKDNI